MKHHAHFGDADARIKPIFIARPYNSCPIIATANMHRRPRLRQRLKDHAIIHPLRNSILNSYPTLPFALR